MKRSDVVIYELSVIKQAGLHLTAKEILDSSVASLIARYDQAVAGLDEPILKRVYDVMYKQGLSSYLCADRLNCDRRSLYRYNIRLISVLSKVL